MTEKKTLSIIASHARGQKVSHQVAIFYNVHIKFRIEEVYSHLHNNTNGNTEQS